MIIGNPPFLGGSLLLAGLGVAYTETLRGLYGARLPDSSDLCCYWHEKARAAIVARRTARAGLLATQGIRGQQNRRVLERISETGQLFFAVSDAPWVLAGASVHVSFVGQDDGTEDDRVLDGRLVDQINANLTAGLDLTVARRLVENAGVAFEGDKKGGPFEITEGLAEGMLAAPNPDGRHNDAVVRPWMNGRSLLGHREQAWIIDFGLTMSEEEAALYQVPYEYIRAHVRPVHLDRPARLADWWLHERPRPEMRAAIRGCKRLIATVRHSKHRIWAWLPAATLPDSALVIIARDDDYSFGVLQSQPHELWARGTGTQLREVESGFRYTPTTTFETFPFPRSTPEQRDEIGAAAARLDELREGWLNPADTSDEELKVRTLTNLYNEMPTWLRDVHARLDRAVIAAYGWPRDITDDDLLARLLALNLERAGVADPIG